MSRFRMTVATTFAAVLLFSVPFPVQSQDVRGDAGIPFYVKSPSDRPPPPEFAPDIVGPNRTANDILASIPEKDSVIVIRGTVTMGEREYFSAYPVLMAGSLDEATKACRKEYVMRPQYKATDHEGYTMFVILKDTGSDPDCWRQFRNLETIGLSCDRIMVKTTKGEEAVAWDNPDSTYANSYGLRTFALSPITSK
ncbi:MAG: hypothetical protein JSV28_08695 [Deltaproteobacteria bacterium]|jgi:hypothetical protein|nr:MAG: hypothetical protein JSV28_08695 [Deltaproteobacteria bacterium]